MACFAPKLAEYAQAVEDALAAPDAWSGLCTFIEHVCAMQAADQAVQNVLTTTFPIGRAVEEERAKAFARFGELVGRARAEGKLRADFVPEDLVIIPMANAGVVRAMQNAAPDAWRRFVGLMIDGLRAERAHPLPPPPTPAPTYRAMLRASRNRG